jgi:hypothetical protein
MMTYEGVDVQIHVFLASALVGGGLLASRPGRITPGRESPVPVGQEARWIPEPVWTTWREQPYPYKDKNYDSWVVQPVASLYPGSTK